MRSNKKDRAQGEYTIAPEHILEVKDLHVHIAVDDYDLHAVRGVNFSLKKGETLGLVGESGCGKSVTSKEVLGINPNNCKGTGQILYRTKSGKVLNLLELNRDGAVYRAIRGSEISMIFQEPMTAFSPLYTIGNQLAEIILLHDPKATKASARAHVLEMLKKVGIANPEKRIDQYPHEFSGGMLQRAMIAMMLCCNPDLLIADEPTTALDVTIQAQILELMRSLQKEFGMSILFITHDLGTVANMCDNVAVMYLGEIVEYGTVHQIFHNPQHPYTKGLLRSLPKMNQSREKKLYIIDGVVPLPVELPPCCGFYDRCEYCIEGVCPNRMIPEFTVEPGHIVRCMLMEQGEKQHG
ncbi:MAG: ABC transporter ATP-binding protein [Clostridia bacterium]|nr:ABC transporter ATP-binding protein [Clostridia bacterium]